MTAKTWLARGLAGAIGAVIIWLGVTMTLSDRLIRPSATEKYLDEDEKRVEIAIDRESEFGLWLTANAMRLASGGLLIFLGVTLAVAPWRRPASAAGLPPDEAAG